MYGKSVLTIQLHFTKKEQGYENNLPVLVSQGLFDLYKQDKSYFANIFVQKIRSISYKNSHSRTEAA